MKKIGIITIIDNDNYGNRLQNYAMQEVLKKYDFDITTLKNEKRFNKKRSLKELIVKFIGYQKGKLKSLFKDNKKRVNNFREFNKNIKFSSKLYTAYSKNLKKEYDLFLTGSDQVWKPTYDRMSYMDLLCFADSKQKIAYAPSFGISTIDQKYHKFLRESLEDFKYLSVREQRGAEIIKEITGKDAQVVLDPTLLIEKEEWRKVERKPEIIPERNYILTYFLGNNEVKKKIEKIAQDNNLDIINIMDKENKYYECGPSEFIYLFDNASLIFTDSFHACGFSILFEKPFFVLNRVENGMNNMNSRLDTILKTFKMEYRKLDDFDKINNWLESDYKEVKNILIDERKKSHKFLKEALNQ